MRNFNKIIQYTKPYIFNSFYARSFSTKFDKDSKYNDQKDKIFTQSHDHSHKSQWSWGSKLLMGVQVYSVLTI